MDFRTRLIYRIPLDSIMGRQTLFQWMIIGMSGLYMAFVLIFVLYLLRSIVKPVARLVSFTRIYEPGRKMDFGGDPTGPTEVRMLHEAFIRMTRRLDQSVEENYGMKIKQKEVELSILHSQITPHLLYNTLDSIYWYAVDSGNLDVSTSGFGCARRAMMCDSLNTGSSFRYNAENSGELGGCK